MIACSFVKYSTDEAERYDFSKLSQQTHKNIFLKSICNPAEKKPQNNTLAKISLFHNVYLFQLL